MTQPESELGAAWWSQSLEEMDREVARLATLCRVKILQPGVIERVIRNDSSVCGISNEAAFRKLRDALMMHYHLRDRAVDALGQAQASALVKRVIDRLAARYGDALGKPE